jgi:4-deoxy-L-threo-5-hexosulose-uronate ketol-isomerase
MPAIKSVELKTINLLKAENFLDRRELGIINIGDTGSITVDGTEYALNHREALYIGQGNKNVKFFSKSSKTPAKFYLNSTPAHKKYPSKK